MEYIQQSVDPEYTAHLDKGNMVPMDEDGTGDDDGRSIYVSKRKLIFPKQRCLYSSADILKENGEIKEITPEVENTN